MDKEEERAVRVFALTALTMVAFAANSILNRLAIVEGGMDAVLFAAVRLSAGALLLAGLIVLQKRGFAIGGRGRVWGVAGLLIYIFGFSLAYTALDAGMGALILFGVVQITMFGAAVMGGEGVPGRRWLGAGMAMAGLSWLLWPTGTQAVAWPEIALMVAAGIGWGIYSLVGRAEKDASQATAMNFLIAAPIGIAIAVLLGAEGAAWSPMGVFLAVLSGAVTSGLGYALWYAVLPDLGATRASVAQLTVPVIAALGGFLLLGEAVTMTFVLSALLVLGGVWVSVRP